MAEYLRLRQICLVAPHLESVISDISAIMGLNVRAAYLEVVSDALTSLGVVAAAMLLYWSVRLLFLPGAF